MAHIRYQCGSVVTQKPRGRSQSQHRKAHPGCKEVERWTFKDPRGE